MPKASPLQPSFSAGEFSPKLYGRTDSERYKTGLATCLNYLPTTQGPIISRPGFKYVADAKDASKPPALIAFKFSQTQNYILEFGDRYLRFFTNNGQITTTSTNFKVSGVVGTTSTGFGSSNFYAMRTSPISTPTGFVTTSSVVASGSILEIETPYRYPDVFDLKVAQKEDTLYIVHSSYPEYKLQRLGAQNWDLKAVLNQDGPYLPFNSYMSKADSANVQIFAGPAPFVAYIEGGVTYSVTTFPVRQVSNATSGTGGRIRIASTAHKFSTGDKVVITSVAGTTEANNDTSTIDKMSWPVIKIDDNSFELDNSTFSNAYVGSGLVYPYLFRPITAPGGFNDVGRNMALIRRDGGRAWGRVQSVFNPASATIHFDLNVSPDIAGSSANNIVQFWQMGVYSPLTGYPNAITFHQQRLTLGGAPQFPQQIDASVSGETENFAPSGSSQVVTDRSALQFTLDSDQLNIIRWIKSESQGLLAGSVASEWNISPSNQAAALVPTNINAKQTSYFGSQNADAVQTGNTTLYIQRGQRRVRELNYFFQVNTYRSTDLSELSDHITNPGLTKLVSQRESIPIVWGLRTDGQVVGMVYSRDDDALKVGWTKLTLGGRSDSGNSAPVVKSMDVIPSTDGRFDSLWCATQRFINGTSVVGIEYMTKVFDDETRQEDAYQVDYGATFNNPKTITNITIAGSAIVTAASHGFSNDDTVKINAVVGLNSSSVDVNGVIFNSNLVNARTFVVASSSTNAFFLKDFDGNYISSLGYSPYVSGGEARKLVSTISGFTWLKNENVAILTDGGVHPVTQINSAGVLALQWPAAKVQVGLAYNSDGKTLRLDAGSGDGSAIGKIRRPSRVAFMLNQAGNMSIGVDFNNLTPLEFSQSDVQSADSATPLFSGIVREGLESQYDFEGQICFRQTSPLPGMVQSLTTIVEENDV